MTGAALLGIVLEAPWHVTPELRHPSPGTLVVFGDSLTAGLSGETTWPKLLRAYAGMEVHDFSKVGAKAGSTLETARKAQFPRALILVEIGGNDLLGTTSSQQFSDDLERLLDNLAPRANEVVMFELPLPPFCNGYGRAQRQLATKYGVKLIPKRVLMSVLMEDGTTLDSIHLTPEGHEKMVRIVLDSLFRKERERVKL